MPAKIYLLDDESGLTTVEETPYDSEALLQRLLADYPDLLAGDQMDGENPRRFLLISQEMRVPDGKVRPKRWSLDHLFLDQDGIPTLIEVKRSTDSRIRREVVGQMLDYAANAVAYWPVADIIERFEGRCQSEGLTPSVELNNFLDEADASEDFWEQVATNLANERIRLVFLADSIPRELKRVVEFLNEQMDRSEVLAIEVKQFHGGGVTALVPRVLGASEKALQKKAAASGSRADITETEFLAHIATAISAKERAVYLQLIEWADQQSLVKRFAKGPLGFQFFATLDFGGRKPRPMIANTKGWVRLPMRSLKHHPPLDIKAKRDELGERIKDIPGLVLTESGMEGLPKVPIADLTSKRHMATFLEALTWLVAELRSAG